jgi:hypothetical protein
MTWVGLNEPGRKIMNLAKVIAELKAELVAVEDAIVVLERLARGQGRRRGRPPLLLVGSSDITVRRKRRPFSAETKKKMAAAQKKRWAAYRKNRQQNTES